MVSSGEPDWIAAGKVKPDHRNTESKASTRVSSAHSPVSETSSNCLGEVSSQGLEPVFPSAFSVAMRRTLAKSPEKKCTHTHHLKWNKRQFILGPNFSDHGLGI